MSYPQRVTFISADGSTEESLEDVECRILGDSVSPTVFFWSRQHIPEWVSSGDHLVAASGGEVLTSFEVGDVSDAPPLARRSELSVTPADAAFVNSDSRRE